MDNIQRDIELTAQLLRAESDVERNELTRAYDEVFAQLENYRAALMKSSMPDGEKILHALSRALERTEIFLSYPQMLGKTLVGLVSFNDELFRQDFASFLSERIVNRLLIDSNLPCLLLARSGDEIDVLNDADNEIALDDGAYTRTNRQLHRYELDIREWLRAFTMRAEDRSHANLSFVWLPSMYMDLKAPFNRNLLDKLDALIVFAPSAPSPKQTDRLKRFRAAIEQRPLYIVPDSVSERELPEVLRRIDFARMNHLFLARLQLSLFDVDQFYRRRLRESEADMKQLGSDLINLNIDDTREILSTLQNHTRQEKAMLENEQFALSKAARQLIEKASAFESLLASRMQPSVQFLFRAETLETCGELILRAVEIGELNIASTYARWLQENGIERAYVFEMLISDAQGQAPSYNQLERLKREPDDETIRRAKLRLRRRLGLSDSDYMQIARDIKHLSTADEFYYRGRWLEHAGDVKEAINHYKRATREGSTEASERLLSLSAARPQDRLLEWLASRLVPEANYRLGVRARNEKQFGRSLTQFKLAAAHEYLPAIKELASYFRHKVFGKKFSELPESEQRDKLSNCLQLHQYILQRDSSDSEVREAVGDLYRRLGDERRAFEHWDRCSTSSAAYKCGRLFQFPDGAFPQDLDRAENYFERASGRGHEKASTELEKVRNWRRNQERRQAREQERQSYESQRSYSPRVETHEERSSGLCVITSAVCETLGKGDDCDELMTMRSYRDAARERSPIVAELIEEYYRVAPLLVERLDRREDRLSEYARLWEEYIVETYRLIKAGEARAATLKYIEMVTSLCRTYGVSLADGIEDKIARLR